MDVVNLDLRNRLKFWVGPSSAALKLNLPRHRTFGFSPKGKKTGSMNDIRFSNLESSQVAVTIADPRQHDVPLIYVNTAFEKLTGYGRDFCVGQNCRFLQGGANRSSGVNKFREALENNTSCSVCVQNERSDGETFFNYVFLAPFEDERARPLVLGCQFEFRHQTKLKDVQNYNAMLAEHIFANLDVRQSVTDEVYRSMKIRSDAAFNNIQHHLQMQKINRDRTL